MELIDKAAVVAEIERRRTNIKEYCLREGHDKRFDVVPEQLAHILSFIDTLEVKEVDLEKIIEQTYHDRSVTDTSDMDHVTYENIASYFFELGLKANQKEE